MMSKNDILNFIKHVHRRERGIPDRRPMHPRREWLIGIFISLLIVAGGAIYTMQTFEKYKNIDKRTYTVDLQIPTYNQALAHTVIADYADREARYGELANGIEIFIPPVEVEVATTTATTTEEVASSTEAVE